MLALGCYGPAKRDRSRDQLPDSLIPWVDSVSANQPDEDTGVQNQTKALQRLKQ